MNKTELELLQALAQAYHIDMQEGARGKAGAYGADADDGAGNPQGKAVQGGFTGTPQRGLGRNFKGDKDKIASRYKAQLRADKMKDRGISDSDRRKRAQDNIGKNIDKVLKKK